MSDRLKYLETLLVEDASNSFIKFAIAKEYEGLEKSSEALEKYEALRQDDPAYVGLYYHYAKLLETKEEFEKAIQIYKEGLTQAKAQGDKHSYAELEAALWEIED